MHLSFILKLKFSKENYLKLLQRQQFIYILVLSKEWISDVNILWLLHKHI